jgi:hypothetical protein
MSRFDQILNKGHGLAFWLLMVTGALGFYGLLWLLLALGTMAGMA